MTPAQFVAQYTQCGATTRGEAAALLGISRRNLIRYAHGELPVPPVVQRLLQMIRLHGEPKKWTDEK